MIRLRRASMVIIFAAAALLASPTVAGAPRIGLVLGGGGAAGVAHVGVIRELERLGVRPDIVTGTSMGAIIGGLYAAGFTPDDLERVALDIDWDSILDDSAERRLEQPLRRDSRLDELSVQADLPIGVSVGGARLRAGLVDGVTLTAILAQLTTQANRIDDFDDLPIPFRAVATDLLTGEPVVLGRGPLVDAIRASMSIPALFPPVMIDGRLLVDGGVSNNLPIDVARAMGADIVIVSSIPPAEKDVSELGSFAASLGQTMSIFIHARTRQLVATLTPEDVLLTPDVGSVGMLDFAEAPATIVEGVAAVRDQQARYSAMAAERQAPAPRDSVGDVRNAPLAYDRIVVEYDGRLDPEIIRRRLGLPASGAATGAEIEEAIARVYGLDLFDSVVYRHDRIGGQDVLVVAATQRNDGLGQLRFGIALNDTFGGDGDFTIALGAGFTELNRLGARLDLDLSFGRTDAIRARLEQPLGLDQAFALRLTGGYSDRNGFVVSAPNDQKSEIAVQRAIARAELFWTPGDWGLLGIGFGYTHQTVEAVTGVIPGANRARTTEDQFPVSFGVDYDTLDDPDLPRDGEQIAAVVSYDLNDDDSPAAIEFDALVARSFDQHTVSAFARGEGDLDPDDLNPRFIGGFQNLSGFSDGELIGNVAGLVGLRHYRRFGFDHPFGNEAYVGSSLEFGGAFIDWDGVGDGDGVFAGSVFAGVQTLFGPLVLGFGAAEQGNYSGTFSLGFQF